MILLRYNAAKLLLMDGLLLFFLVPLALMFLYPEELAQSRRGSVRMLSSGFGHDVVLPVLIGGCLLMMWRCAATALGSGVAIEAKSDSIQVTDMWGTKRIPWARLAPIGIERNRTLTSTHHRLVFRGGGRAAKVPVGLTELQDTGLTALAARIEAMRYGSGRPQGPRPRNVPVAAAVPGPMGFGRKRS